MLIIKMRVFFLILCLNLTAREILALSNYHLLNTINVNSGVGSLVSNEYQNLVANGHFDGSVRVWSVINGGSNLQLKYTLDRNVGGHTNVVESSLLFLSNFYYLASGSWDKSIKVWELEEGIEANKRLKFTFDSANGGHTDDV